MVKALLLITTLLAIISGYEIAYIDRAGYSIYTDDLECLKYFKTKSIFLGNCDSNYSQSSSFLANLSKTMPVRGDVFIDMYGSGKSPSAVISNFTSNINSSLYNIVWLQKASYEDDIRCNFLMTYIYYC